MTPTHCYSALLGTLLNGFFGPNLEVFWWAANHGHEGSRNESNLQDHKLLARRSLSVCSLAMRLFLHNGIFPLGILSARLAQVQAHQLGMQLSHRQ